MKALFLDRDGVINELLYHQEQGIIDSPFTVEQFRLFHGVGEAINKLRDMDYKVVLVYCQHCVLVQYISDTRKSLRME